MSTDKEAPFWMVYGWGQQSPTTKHYSEDQAATEAKRLSHAHPGLRFFVLEAKRGYMMAPPPLTEIVIDPDEMPF